MLIVCIAGLYVQQGRRTRGQGVNGRSRGAPPLGIGHSAAEAYWKTPTAEVRMNADLLGGLAEAGARAHDVQEGQSVWAAWSLDLPVLIPIGLAAFLYARGLSRWTDRHRSHPWW